MDGREPEQQRVQAFLTQAETGPAVLVIEGDAGIGKTTLFQAALTTATERGFTVLSCRAAEAEAAMAYIGLIDLLAPVADEVLHALPQPLRTALGFAMLREAHDPGLAVDHRAVAVA